MFLLHVLLWFWLTVALLAEGVDRNYSSLISCIAHLLVALLAEGVDRNQTFTPPL